MLALYHNDMSLCAQKVRVGLAEKKLDWESRHLVLRAAEHQQPWYIELNRRAVVPTLIDGEKVIRESNVILEYLDEAYPDPALAPRDVHRPGRLLTSSGRHPKFTRRSPACHPRATHGV